MLGELHSVVGNKLVDVAILVSFRLGMANKYNHLSVYQLWLLATKYMSTYAGFPHLGSWTRCAMS